MEIRSKANVAEVVGKVGLDNPEAVILRDFEVTSTSSGMLYDGRD